MEKVDLLKFLTKKCRVNLINGYVFNGYVIAVSDTSLSLKDKYDLPVTIRNEDISFILEASF